MLVTMNGTYYGVDKGLAPKLFKQGQVYNISDGLAQLFIRQHKASPAAPSVEDLLLAKKILGKAADGAPIDSTISLFHNRDLIRVAYFLEEIAEIVADAGKEEAPTPGEMFLEALNKDTASTVAQEAL